MNLLGALLNAHWQSYYHLFEKTQDNKVRFDITDQGIGIPENELLTIFAKFRVSSRTSTPAGSRGVGLAMCKSAIEAHGGITAESKDDRGSTLLLYCDSKI